VFARDRLLPPLRTGDLVAFTGAGAYGAVMASDYNSRPRAAEILVDGDRFAVVKPRREAKAQFADERVPAWLTDRA
jgi:diaminopimelate decarboxylase